MTWKLLTTPPSRSGKYIVGHRGHSTIITYLHPDGEYDPDKTGWQKNPRRYGATHYMPLPEITNVLSEAAEIDFKARGMTRLDPLKPRPTPAPLTWVDRLIVWLDRHFVNNTGRIIYGQQR